MLASLVLFALAPSVPQSWIGTQEAKLLASNGIAYDAFGTVAIDGDTAVVGARRADVVPGSNAEEGAAYVFVRTGTIWSEEARLTASDAAPGDAFGGSVGIDGDTIVVGAAADDHVAVGAGSAYVFVRSGTVWTEQAKLTTSDAQLGDGFSAGSIDGDTVVGAARGTSVTGVAYVFVRSGTDWSEQAKLTASDGQPGDRFRASSLSGDRVLIGAAFDNHTAGVAGGSGGQGSAYVFERIGTSWSEITKLTASDAEADDRFGISGAIDGDTLVVGAALDRHAAGMPGGNGEGSAYVFVEGTGGWSEQAKLTASDASFLGFFGVAVDVQGDLVVVGQTMLLAYIFGGDEGAVYVFARGGTSWTEELKLEATGGFSNWLGASISISGDTVLAGSVGDSELAAQAGAAYIFHLCEASPVTYCTAGSSASGCQATLSATGMASATAVSGFDLMASNVEGDKDGLFFFGAGGRQANSWGNGTSFQCVVPPVKRGGLLTGVGTAGNCDGSFTQDLNGRWCPTCPKPNQNPGAGATVQAQLWYRDPLSSSNQSTSLSDAIEFCVSP